MSKFTEKAFEDAIKNRSVDEYEAYKTLIIGHEQQILDAARLKILLEGNAEKADKLVETVGRAGLTEALAVLLGSCMQICFSIGYDAGRLSLT